MVDTGKLSAAGQVTSCYPAYKSGRSRLLRSLAYEFLEEKDVSKEDEFKEQELEGYIVRGVQKLRLKIVLTTTRRAVKAVPERFQIGSERYIVSGVQNSRWRLRAVQSGTW